MYYCSELSELYVLSLYEGELLGKVNKLYFDKKFKKLIEIELLGENGAKLILPTKNIYNIGKNAITIKNNQQVIMKVEETEYPASPQNSKAYSINGEFLGVVKDLCFNEKYITQKVLLDNESTLDVDKIASYGKTTIIFYMGNERINLNKFIPASSPKSFKQEVNSIASTLPVEEKENVVLVETQIKTQLESSEFLLGRVCVKDIFNFNNELLIKANSLVNKKNLKEINKYGKLRELMLYTK